MADDYSISAKITADTSGFEKGINKAQKASKNLSKSISGVIQGLGKGGLVGALGAVGLASSGLSATLGSVVKIARKVSETINECTEAYKGQVIAERALNTAIANNPFISGESSKALLQFASDMQKVTNYGDDELIPMMTNLVSLGRTESETMQIMSVAMDMSAGMGISLDTAITQLNATLNGNIGRLGQQNAELKGLTEEELMQGKAIEILGEKFRGLSSATADTSKQLQNMKGDFKEALGQFTLPSSDMWNKFWTGFYEKGIEVINKINAFMDAQIIGRKVANTITEQISKIPESNIAGRADYVRKAIKVLTDEELRALGSYLEGSSGYLDIILDHSRKTREEVIAQEEAVNNIANSLTNKIGKEQFSILRNVGQEMENRRIMVKVAKQEAEVKAQQARAEEIATIQLKEQEKIEAKKTDWTSKLLDQRIEMLETERDRAIQNAEEIGSDTLQIEAEYDEKILQLRLKKLTDEKNEELNAVGVSEEDKLKILEFYSNEEALLYEELKKKKKKDNEEEEKNEKSKFSVILGYTKDFANKTAQVFGKVAKTIGSAFSAIGNFVKNTFSAVKNIFSKLFDINVSDMLDSLLKVEDAILTFFVETLPKLPSFFESAFSSVLVLIQSLINAIDWDKVKTVFESIINTFIKYAPQILSGIVELFTKLVGTLSSVLVENAPAIVSALGEMFFTILEAFPQLISNFLSVAGTYLSEIGKFITENGERLTNDLSAIITSLVEGISTFIENGGWKNVLSAILTIQKALETAVTDNLDEIVDTIIDALPDLIQFLIDSIVSASKALSKVIKPIIKLIMAVIDALLEVLLSDEVINAGLDVFSSLIEAIIGEFIPKLASLLLKFLPKIVNSVLKIIPKLIVAIVKGLVNGFVETNWVQVVKDMFTGFVEGVKNFFGIHSPSTLFESFGGYMVEGLVNGLKGISEATMAVIQPFLDFVENTFNATIGGLVDNVKSIVDGFVTLGTTSFDAIKDIIDTIANASFDTVKTAIESVTDIFKSLSELSFDTIVDLTELSFDTLKDSIENTTKALKDITEISLKNLSDSLTSLTSISFNAFNASINSVNSGLYNLANISFSGLTKSIDAVSSGVVAINNSVGSLIDSLGRLITTATEAVKALNPLSGGSGESYSAADAAIDLLVPGGFLRHLVGHANGTQQAQKGMAIVGEAGPELVRFNGGEQVINNRNTQKVLAGMNGGTNNFNVTFNNLQDTSAFAMMNQLKQYNRQMAINGVI